jgi:hypothetical protein
MPRLNTFERTNVATRYDRLAAQLSRLHSARIDQVEPSGGVSRKLESHRTGDLKVGLFCQRSIETEI